MARRLNRRSRKKGLPPGTLMYVGEQEVKKVRIRVMDFDQDQVEDLDIQDPKECYPFKEKPTTSWINVDGIHQKETLECLGEHFDLHPLTLEDIMNTTQRPKAEDYGHYIYIVLKMIYLKNSSVELEQISMILGKNFVITFQEREGDVFDEVRQRIKEAKGRVRKMKADYLAYSLIDAIVDNYFSVLEFFDEKIDQIENALLKTPSPQLLKELYSIKREVIDLRKSVWPLRDMVNGIERSESQLFEKQTMMYLRDVSDHSIHIVDTVDTFREIMSGLHDLYLSYVSNRMNEIMKILTVIATIFMPMTFVAGVYGMNFEFMPELHWKLGYAFAWGLMFVMAILMVSYFRWKKWV